jgi:hypothetical protein
LSRKQARKQATSWRARSPLLVGPDRLLLFVSGREGARPAVIALLLHTAGPLTHNRGAKPALEGGLSRLGGGMGAKNTKKATALSLAATSWSGQSGRGRERTPVDSDSGCSRTDWDGHKTQHGQGVWLLVGDAIIVIVTQAACRAGIYSLNGGGGGNDDAGLSYVVRTEVMCISSHTSALHGRGGRRTINN